jgi:X-Pro dipeptidyl-peptidase (S15 family)
VTDLGPEHRTCQIDADLYIPAGVTAQRRAPALLVTNGFGGDKTDQAALAQGFGEHGWVTLSYTGIGFVDGDTCPITLDDREHDGAAASQLLRFLGGDPSIVAVDDVTKKRVHVDQVIRQDATTGTRYDPAVGMTGGSYGGQIQFATAAYEHQRGTDRVDAIIPLITWNDLSYSLAPENSSLPQATANSGSVTPRNTGVFKYQWSALFTTLGVVNGAEDLQALADPAKFQKFVQDNCGNFDPPVCRALLEVATQGYASQASIDFLRSNSVASYIRNVRVPPSSPRARPTRCSTCRSRWPPTPR